jgi:hypothetical protein
MVLGFGGFGVGLAELILIGLFVLVPLTVLLLWFRAFGRRARRFGYESRRAYLRAAPRSDEERRDAADLALKGLVFCLLGLLVAPLVLIGLVPLFYGGRKLVYASMGLGLMDDGDERRA